MHNERSIPFIPLNLVVFPGEQTMLHIFEPRYKELIKQCLLEDFTFGIPYVQNGKLQLMGTEVRLVQVSKVYDNGEMDIVVEGVNLFELILYSGMMEEQLYPGGVIRTVESEEVPVFLNPELKKLFYTYLELKDIEPEEEELINLFSAYDIARRLKLGNKDKYTVLSTLNEEKRQIWLCGILRYLNYLLRQEQRSVKGNVFLN
jgi:Lon protease-like protein